MTPIYINVFNRLTTTKTLVSQIERLDNAVPIVIDNASDYEPLLEWYDSCPCEVIRLRENLGHHAPWLSGIVQTDRSPWYVVTDCDLDLSGVPADALELLRVPFGWPGRGIVKSGLSLRIDDLPEWQTEVINWERKFWQRSVIHDARFLWALVDTTFAMYRRETPAQLATQVVGVQSVRSVPPYTARHVPWYLDASNMSDEDRHYFATASASNSWIPSGHRLTIRGK